MDRQSRTVSPNVWEEAQASTWNCVLYMYCSWWVYRSTCIFYEGLMLCSQIGSRFWHPTPPNSYSSNALFLAESGPVLSIKRRDPYNNNAVFTFQWSKSIGQYGIIFRTFINNVVVVVVIIIHSRMFLYQYWYVSLPHLYADPCNHVFMLQPWRRRRMRLQQHQTHTHFCIQVRCIFLGSSLQMQCWEAESAHPVEYISALPGCPSCGRAASAVDQGVGKVKYGSPTFIVPHTQRALSSLPGQCRFLKEFWCHQLIRIGSCQCPWFCVAPEPEGLLLPFVLPVPATFRGGE